MSRPKLDPVVTHRIVDLIRAGNYLEVAASATGIHRTTLHRWMRHGRGQKRGRYKKFLNAVEKAQAEAESRDVALIAKAAGDDWRAAAWRLERRSPKKYGPRVQVSIEDALQGAVERLKTGLDEATYLKVLQLLMSDENELAELPDALAESAQASSSDP